MNIERNSFSIKDQIYQILGLLGDGKSFVPPFSICGSNLKFIQRLIRNMFEATKNEYILVEESDCLNTRLIYHKILDKLNTNSSIKFPKTCYSRFNDFMNSLELLLKEDSTTYIVFNNANRINNTLLNNFQLLAKESKKAISLIYLCENPVKLDNLFVSIYLHNYEKEDLYTYLSEYVDDKIDETIKKNLVNIIIESYEGKVSDIDELGYIINYLYKYVKNEKKENINSKLKLMKFLQKYMSILNNHLYIHDLTQDEVEDKNQINNKNKSDLWINLPYLPKLLLISGFLCSYNPPSQDERYFNTVNTNKRKRRKVNTSSKCENTYISKGPGVFTLERLLTIFHCLGLSEIENFQVKDSISIEFYSFISQLVSLNLFEIDGSENEDLKTNYKCTLEISEAEEIGNSLKIDIHKYMCEFN